MAQISPNFCPALDPVSPVLNKYDRILVDVSGFTDSDGSRQYNLDHSQRRANSVADYPAQHRSTAAGSTCRATARAARPRRTPMPTARPRTAASTSRSCRSPRA